MKHGEREQVYERDEYYWGKEPSTLAEITAKYAPFIFSGRTLIDLGAGEGRDAVFFAERGFDVYAMDRSPAGLKKCDRLADEREVPITSIEGDVNDFEFPTSIDVIHSSGVLHYIQPENRNRQFSRFKRDTTAGGLHSILVFVDHPEIPLAPDLSENVSLYERDELQEYYSDWELLHSEERIFDDDSGGEPHQHAGRIVIARKP